MKTFFALTFLLNTFFAPNLPCDTCPAAAPAPAENATAVQSDDDGLVEFTGVVSDLIAVKGMGTVQDPTNKKKYPFHFNGGTETTVKLGDEVVFVVARDPKKKKPEASKIKKKKP
jgi:hypothetical protein